MHEDTDVGGGAEQKGVSRVCLWLDFDFNFVQMEGDEEDVELEEEVEEDLEESQEQDDILG
jgi:hypothetical protein